VLYFLFHAFSIGYPVVTLGFGFKSYVSYKMRLRKQKEVQKENEFYMQLLQQALPPEQQMLQRQEREAEEGVLIIIITHIHDEHTYAYAYPHMWYLMLGLNDIVKNFCDYFCQIVIFFIFSF